MEKDIRMNKIPNVMFNAGQVLFSVWWHSSAIITGTKVDNEICNVCCYKSIVGNIDYFTLVILFEEATTLQPI